ncbi:RING-finger domain-containing protein [Yasminevirus sp. GU-2018]|uniref:RING-finger domain-containing protein n=1 Tax=Yasminevirus sp. GU-2018 TaxID=2420051 RepID=A0A5K0U915_9VIRU|nr:RING-finger domain-containing protein [Yasminevirus sp. GU-2018]
MLTSGLSPPTESDFGYELSDEYIDNFLKGIYDTELLVRQSTRSNIESNTDSSTELFKNRYDDSNQTTSLSDVRPDACYEKSPISFRMFVDCDEYRHDSDVEPYLYPHKHCSHCDHYEHHVHHEHSENSDHKLVQHANNGVMDVNDKENNYIDSFGVVRVINKVKSCNHTSKLMCGLYYECCKRVFSCIRCHEEFTKEHSSQTNSHINPKMKPAFMICKVCGEYQFVDTECIECDTKTGVFICTVCDIVDFAERGWIHCPKCRVCYTKEKKCPDSVSTNAISDSVDDTYV